MEIINSFQIQITKWPKYKQDAYFLEEFLKYSQWNLSETKFPTMYLNGLYLWLSDEEDSNFLRPRDAQKSFQKSKILKIKKEAAT